MVKPSGLGQKPACSADNGEAALQPLAAEQVTLCGQFKEAGWMRRAGPSQEPEVFCSLAPGAAWMALLASLCAGPLVRLTWQAGIED